MDIQNRDTKNTTLTCSPCLHGPGHFFSTDKNLHGSTKYTYTGLEKLDEFQQRQVLVCTVINFFRPVYGILGSNNFFWFYSLLGREVLCQTVFCIGNNQICFHNN